MPGAKLSTRYPEPGRVNRNERTGPNHYAAPAAPWRSEEVHFRAAASRRSTGRTQDIDRHVGARVRERRIMLGLTQQQLADLIGVTYQQAHKYERGINRISAGRLYEISQVLSVPIGYFFDGLEGRFARGQPARAHVPRTRAQLRPDPERAPPGSAEPARPRIGDGGIRYEVA